MISAALLLGAGCAKEPSDLERRLEMSEQMLQQCLSRSTSNMDDLVCYHMQTERLNQEAERLLRDN